MTESSAEETAAAAPASQPQESTKPNGPTKRCDDPTKPNIDYLVAVSVATKRSELFADDKGKVDERYKKLDGAQKKFEDSGKAQKKPFEDLKCQLQRILKTLYHTVDEHQRKRLKKCWCDVVAKTDDETKPVNCDILKGFSCKDLECKGPKPINELRSKEEPVKACVKRYDDEFDKLAELPEKMEGLIGELITKATELEDAIAAPESDPHRNYVAYLDLERAFLKLWRKLRISAAEYGCKLKNAFVDLLEAHRKWICLQVAIHEWSTRKEYEDEEREKKAGKIIDQVLEECEPTKPAEPTDPEKPGKWESECKSDTKPSYPTGKRAEEGGSEGSTQAPTQGPTEEPGQRSTQETA